MSKFSWGQLQASIDQIYRVAREQAAKRRLMNQATDHDSHSDQSRRLRDWRGGNAVVRTRRRDARLLVLQVLVLSLIGTLLMRLVWMQTANAGEYNTASANSVRQIVVPAQRGLILDQVGRPMVANRSSLSVTVDRAELARQKDGGDATLAALAAKLGVTQDSIEQRLKSCGTPGAPAMPLCWNGPNEQPVVVAEDVPQAVGLQLMESGEDLQGVQTELTPTRSYPAPYGINLAHVAGYLGQMTADEVAQLGDQADVLGSTPVGRAGLEKEYNSVLSGTPGVQDVTVSRSGKVTDTLRNDPAVPGENLVTSIDAKLQALVEKELTAAFQLGRAQGYPSDSGAIVVEDVNTGRILAMASGPTYNPNVWVGGISAANYNALTDPDKGYPLLNRAIQGTYAPASTFKAISTAAAIKAGFNPNSTYPCPSQLSIGGQVFRNYESEAYGNINLAKALAVSCDTVFYKIANDMWINDGGLNPSGTPHEYMYNEAKSFGLGSQTGIDLPGESSGRIVGREQKKSDYAQRKDDYCRRAVDGYPEVKPKSQADLLQSYAKDYCADGDQFRAGDALNFAIGQGDTAVTPLQMLEVYSAIANGGTLWEPMIAKAAMTRDGTVTQTFNPQVKGQVDASPSTLAYLRSALTQTSTSGTASNVFRDFPLSKIPVAAKTGTGEVVGKKSTGWLASFAPANNPRYAVICMVSQGGTGAGTCGPSVRRIYEALFGVNGYTVNPSKSILEGGKPNDSVPQVTSDGLGVHPSQSASPSVSGTQTATPSATPSMSSGTRGGESPLPSPSYTRSPEFVESSPTRVRGSP